MTKDNIQRILRTLPAVDELLNTAPIQGALKRHPRKLVLASIRQVLDNKRQRILSRPDLAETLKLDQDHLISLCMERLEELTQYTLQPVVNATGIVIHTNLGRSLLASSVIDRLAHLCSRYNNLEYDIKKGRRGSRYVHAEAILCEISGAEAALVVNNNAGAVFLVLNTLARSREVIVSRGEMVEIGGSFRIPDVMASSGAILKEIGCTNRTHLRDYESAINDGTALLLKVHCSNYRILGFTTSVSLGELAQLGQRHGIPVMEDLGSGSFMDVSRFGLEKEPTAQEAVAAGADIITFSGDKLLGGPQAGIILGRRDIIEKCKKNPLTRAFRVDKMTLAALEATLRLYRDEQAALDQIPTLRMIALPLETLHKRAELLASKLTEHNVHRHFLIGIEKSVSQVGGGSLPAQDMPTYVVTIACERMSAAKIERKFRANTPPIIGRIESDQLFLDVRTILEDDFDLICEAFKRLDQQLETTSEL